MQGAYAVNDRYQMDAASPARRLLQLTCSCPLAWLSPTLLSAGHGRLNFRRWSVAM